MPPALAFLAADAVAIIVVLVALAIELRSGEIPNALTLPLVPIGFVMCLRDGRWGERGVALLVAIAVVVILFRGGYVGGGALKLFAGLAVLLGPSALAIAIVTGVRFLVGYLRRKPEDVALEWFATTPWIMIGCVIAAGLDYLRFTR